MAGAICATIAPLIVNADWVLSPREKEAVEIMVSGFFFGIGFIVGILAVILIALAKKEFTYSQGHFTT